ncbi:hypothetical protein BGZ72_003305, partial [Mortierella alpina]
MRALLNCIYNRRPPPDSKSSADVKYFIEQVKDVLPIMSAAGTINEQMPYPASTVLRSTATAVAASMRQHFGRGAKTLAERAKNLQKKGLLSADECCKIDAGRSAVENFQRLNKITGNRYKIAPISSMEDGFITLSELDLIDIFCKDKDLKCLLQRIAAPEFSNTALPAAADMRAWISDKEP